MKYNLLKSLCACLVILFFAQCNEEPAPLQASTPRKDTATAKPREKAPEPLTITYHPLVMKDSGKVRLKNDFTPEMRNIIYALNRVDGGHASRIDTLIIPDTLVADRMFYSPFPQEVPFLKDVKKMVYFSYPIQAFAAYESGKLVLWGPSSMGKKATPTPTGLFFTNWKGKEVRSSVKEEWILKWNFNISNRGGVGWHLYAMPGYPASHSCLRLLEEDARFLYDWAEQWMLKSGQLVANGTPTIVFGSYPWGQQCPWKALMSNAKANEITVEMLQQETESFLPRIMEAQEKRAALSAGGAVNETVADTTATAQ
jgi:hypothetical protein